MKRIIIAVLIALSVMGVVAGKTIYVEVSNTAASTFDGGRMFKIEADDEFIPPVDGGLLNDGYVPAGDGTVAFKLPDTFRGKLALIFYKANLRGLRITATYK
jgi:hypothetical protein